MELSGSNWGIFHDFPWKWLPGYRFGLNQSLSQPVEHLGCTMALNGLLDNIPRRCFFPLNIGIVQWITVEETTSYIYIYILDIYVHKYIHCLLDVYIYIVHIWLRIKTVNLEIDRKCSRLAKLCWTQVHLLRDPFGATQNLLWRQGSCRSHHRIPYHDRLLLVCWRTCARLTGTSA